jgi:2,4-diaminopentanoate dehydrogenase
VLIKGSPDLAISVHGHDAIEPGPAGGGNGTAANRIVNAIPAVCAAAPGILSPLDIPPLTGAAQMRA